MVVALSDFGGCEAPNVNVLLLGAEVAAGAADEAPNWKVPPVEGTSALGCWVTPKVKVVLLEATVPGAEGVAADGPPKVSVVEAGASTFGCCDCDTPNVKVLLLDVAAGAAAPN